jgi:hypothetical protein
MLSTYLEVIKQGNVFNYYFFGSVADTKKAYLKPGNSTFVHYILRMVFIYKSVVLIIGVCGKD